MLKFCVLVSALLVAGSKQQPPVSEASNSTISPLKQIIHITCDTTSDLSCHASLSLEKIAKEAKNFSMIYITITVSQLQLNTMVNFSQLKLLTINGDQESNTNLTCIRNNAGLVLHSIDKITLTNITIVHCGAVIHTLPSTIYSSAIIILHSGDVDVKNVNVVKSRGTGLTILNHQKGFILIESSQFSENTLPLNDSDDSGVTGGGGVYIGGFEQDPMTPITFKFSGCTFEKNMAHTRYYHHLYTDDVGQLISGHGIGGGAAILFERALTDVHVIFSACTFAGNKALLGAGLASEMGSVADIRMKNILVRVEHSLFEENGCNKTLGGGMHISYHDKSNVFDFNNYTLFNVTFRNNYAQYGGGLYFSSYHKHHIDHSNIVEINKCKFESNCAHIGSAVDITPSVFERLLSGTFVTPTFRDCTFCNNMVKRNIHPNQMQATYGIGTVYVSLYNIVLEGNIAFTSNLGTAIYVVNGNINMSHSDTEFINNSGVDGGAIALIGVSSVIVGPSRNYVFNENKALERGGAIFVMSIDNHDFTTSKTCFIQYFKNIPAQEWSCNISFIGNTANTEAGNTIFATSLHPCQFIKNGTRNDSQYEFVDAKDTFSARGITIEQDKGSKVIINQIATEGATPHINAELTDSIFPGEEIEHGVSYKDDLGNQVKKLALVATTQEKQSEVQPDTTLSSCFGKHITLKGDESVTGKLYLQTTGSRSSIVQLEIKLSECPPGFAYDNNTERCNCIHKEYVGLVKCDTKRSVSYITPGFWIGLVEDINYKQRKELATTYCFLYFCNYNNSCKQGLAIELPKSKTELNKKMCGESRTGTACGSCAPGYTTYFHSPTYQCRRVDTTLCKLGWLFYIISELVPVTVIFITVIIFNINFTSGTINGFILFSQLLYSFNIDASGLITFPNWITVLMDKHGLLYGLFSLDFFETENLSFCLFSNASALDIVMFKYVTIVYAFLLVTMVIWFMNKCGGRCLGRCFRITTVKLSIIHGISAFLILCYSRCIRISLNLLDSFSLYVRSGSNITTSRRVWLNGDVDFFSKKHLPYALPALFCLLMIGILPPMLLLAYPLLNKCFASCGLEESKFITFIYRKIHISSLKPLLDSFQGCFKDNLRFFAGLYFLYRWIAQIISVAPSTGFSRYDVSVNILLTAILALHSLCQPYARKGHNMIDTLLFTDLIFITAITFFHLYVIRARVSQQTAVEDITVSAAIQVVLVYLPLIIMIVYIVASVYRFSCGQRNPNKPINKLSSRLRDLMAPIIGEDSLETEELPHRLITGDVEYESSYAATE